ncbi:BAHD acyltransferase [Glycine soja]|uniref:BAHD acyltransferase n=1 Tax=Glycine soja TaxID=3848 RepID=A0A0B2SNB6_GLYSO|nr:BAHD acyltransferase [Glycine soja]
MTGPLNREKEQEETETLIPGASLFPQENLPVFSEVLFVENDAVCRRFVFEASEIDSLKAIVSSHNVPNPTRVEVVSALIYKRAVSALGLSFKTTSFRTAVNLRNRTAASVPEAGGSDDEESQIVTMFCCASWCRFPMYEADFGWGKPVWFTTSESNSIVLMDTRDGGGIEALVNMEEQDMIRFERDVELLQYASLNPAVGHGS